MLLTVTVNCIPFPLPEQDTHNKYKWQKEQKEGRANMEVWSTASLRFLFAQ